MSDLNYSFSPSKFGEKAKGARHCFTEKTTQAGFVDKLADEQGSCAPGIKIATVKRYESGNGGLGILSAIKISKALEMPLPAAKLDPRVKHFTRNLVCDSEQASEDFDVALHNAMSQGLARRNGTEWNPLVMPKGFMGMICAQDDTSPPVRISIEGMAPFLRLVEDANLDASVGDLISSPEKIDSSGILPVDLVAIFGELTWWVNEMKDSQSGNLPRFDRRPAAVWRHVLNARSENVGLIRLNDEVERFEQLREEH